MLAVAEHAEVAGHAAVGMDRDAGQDLLALLEPEALHVEVGQADPVGGVGRVLAVVRGHRLREALEVLGDLAVSAIARRRSLAPALNRLGPLRG